MYDMQRGMSALSKAAPSINYNANHTEIVRELLRAGADPAIQDVVRELSNM